MTDGESVNKLLCRISDTYGVIHTEIDRLFFGAEEFVRNQEFIRGCIENGNTCIKYKGKYAFIRVLHAQEIFSSVFSMFSAVSAGVALAYAVKLDHAMCRIEWHSGYAQMLKVVLFLHLLTWLFSTVFHIRDCYGTQCLDYFGALLSISSTIVLSCVRLSICPGPVQTLVCAVVLFHTLYLHLVEFNFVCNSAVCGILFGVNMILWSVWYSRIRADSYSRMLRLSLVGVGVAGAFQVIDFGPLYFLVDSHALWHILGWIFTSVLYIFLVVDMEKVFKKCKTKK